MSGFNELLRDNIIAKLKEYDAYIDNELPDYIMVMLANNKTIEQIDQDLRLFLGDNSERFTAWLRNAVANPESLKKERVTEISVPLQKRKRDTWEEPRKEVPHLSESYEEEEETRPPSPKYSKMRSDRYEREDASRARRRERVSARQSEEQRSRMMSKKTVRAQPDSTRDRDRDLRELIGGGRKHSDDHHSQQSWGSGRRRQGEIEERELGEREAEDEGEEEEEGTATSTSIISSVVRLVERPKRTDEGGSRLLRRAILGLGPVLKRGKTLSSSVEGGVIRESKREKVIILPASVLSDGTAKKIMLANVQNAPFEGSASQPISSTISAEDDEDGLEENEEDDDGVIVEVEGGGEAEFEDEFQIHGMLEGDEIDEPAVAAIQRVAPRGGRIKVVSSPHILYARDQAREKVDLRDIINKSRQGKKEIRSPRFVVTLGGVEEQQERNIPLAAKSQIVSPATGTERKSVKERLGAKAVIETTQQSQVGKEDKELEEGEIEDNGGGEMPERCKFWPNCKNGDSCPYHHPSIPCKLFPDCKYGKKCLFVHPQCKYNSRCTRVDCSYMHTAPRHLSTVQTQIIPQVIPTAIPMPQMFRPTYKPSYSYSGGPSRGQSSRFPNKAALSWKPAAHISERKFAVAEDQTTNLSV